MKRLIKLIPASLFILLLTPGLLIAQQEKNVEKKVIEKKKIEKEGNKEIREVIIRKSADKKEKITIEIDGDNVRINGKPVKDFSDKDINISINKFRDFDNLRITSPRGNMNLQRDQHEFKFFGENENKAMLGIGTVISASGTVEIKEVIKESAAEKAGLKKGDIITHVDEIKIASPDELTKAIGDHKPGDKVVIAIQRDKTDQKINVELGKWEGMYSKALKNYTETITRGNDALTKGRNMFEMDRMLPGLPRLPKATNPPSFEFWKMDSKPKLGLSVQDTEDGNNVKVVEVDTDGNAGKAGIKKDDLITHLNDKEVKTADDVAKIVRENKEGSSYMIKVLRNGKVQNFEVKIPKKLKTVDL